MNISILVNILHISGICQRLIRCSCAKQCLTTTEFLRWTRIVGNIIHKFKTSTTYPLYETMQHFVLINKWCSWVQSALPTIRLYPQSRYDQFLHRPLYSSNSLLLVNFADEKEALEGFEPTQFRKGISCWLLGRRRHTTTGSGAQERRFYPYLSRRCKPFVNKKTPRQYWHSFWIRNGLSSRRT